MPKLIIFDIGGVIEDFTEEQYIDYICGKLGIDKRRFGKKLLSMLPSAEEGRISTGEMLQRLSSNFKVSAKKLEWAEAIPKIAKINPKMANLVNVLNKKYRVVLLTNVSRSRYMENVNLGFFREVRASRVYASCYLHTSKPKARIYRYVLDAEGVKASDAIFIDNLKVNVDGARKIGIDGIVFTKYEALLKDLKKRGIRW